MRRLRCFMSVIVMMMVLLTPMTAFAGSVPEDLLSHDGAKVFFAELISYDKEQVLVSPFKVIKGDMDEREWVNFSKPCVVGNFIPMAKNVYLFAYFDENNPIYVFNATSYDTKELKLKGTTGDMWERFEKMLNEGKFEAADAVRRDALNADIKLTGEEITLTEFLNLEDTSDVEKIYICATDYSREQVMDIDAFLEVSDSIVLKKTETGAQAAKTGIYVDVQRMSGERSWAYISEKGEVDNYYHIFSRLPARQYITSVASINALIDLVSASQGMPQMRHYKVFAFGGIAVLIMLAIVVFVISKRKKRETMRDVRDFGATGDGKTDDTESLQKAIDECAATGTVLKFSPGIYRTGTIFLRDNSKIVIKRGAVISGIPELSAYANYGGTFVDAVNRIRGKAILVACDVKNIEISGHGKITGNGHEFDKETNDRPFLVRFVNSEDIKVSDIRMEESVSWCFHIDKCKNVYVHGIKVYNRGNENNDGIDIDSSENVTLINCDVSSGDDAICLKSTSRRVCRDIYVKNCKISTECGGFKIGTESVGDYENIVCEDCYFYDVLACGIKITVTDGAVAKDVKIKNVKMDNCTGPIFISAGLRQREYAGEKKDTPSNIINLEIDGLIADVIKAPSRGYYNIGIDGGKEGDPEEFLKSLYDYGDWCEALGGIIISGSEKAKIQNISLKNMEIDLPGGFTDENWEFNVREMGTLYPEFHRFDPVPAKGIYIRHASGVTIENVELTYKAPDIRDEIYTEDAENVQFI
ncbi:MAG: right-handed parallel beta-helix repeat-containing protein [Clostridia bacterium]|nr:right-handed parallel beta-helix repeat-containing protein [Clostridia bacterium]